MPDRLFDFATLERVEAELIQLMLVALAQGLSPQYLSRLDWTS
jgi:hypothetical protein